MYTLVNKIHLWLLRVRIKQIHELKEEEEAAADRVRSRTTTFAVVVVEGFGGNTEGIECRFRTESAFDDGIGLLRQ